MGTIVSTIRVGQKPTKTEMVRIRKELKEAKKRPLNLEDCPELPPEALKEFAFMAAERNRQRRRQAVTIRVVPDCLTKYKSLGKGYTGIMADVLNYVANNPKILTRASKATVTR
jgi:uncharacterized protein (DUF4415 family)